MSLDNDIALLQRIATLRLLGEDALRVLAIGAENRLIEEREILFHAGEPADAGYMIQQGSLSLAPRNTEIQARPSRSEPEPCSASSRS